MVLQEDAGPLRRALTSAFGITCCVQGGLALIVADGIPVVTLEAASPVLSSESWPPYPHQPARVKLQERPSLDSAPRGRDAGTVHPSE